MHILEEIHEVAVSKNVNFLIGSGCSSGAIGTMNTYWQQASEKNNHNLIECGDGKYCSDCRNEGNKLLTEDVKRISEMILEKYENTEEANFKKIQDVSKVYISFVQEVINLMNRMNSRQNPRNINIFTTNYDLFIENALDKVSKTETFVINDGARGYFKRVLDSSNFNRTVSYRGPSNNYVDEIPSISLIKPHGSVNWEKTADEEIEIKAEVVDIPVVVNPDGHESRETFEENYFHDMLRIFQTELDKPQSVLFVIGFSFQDKHIAKMMQRALRNKELNVYIFCYSNNTEGTIRKNLECDDKDIKNLKFIRPQDVQPGGPMGKQESGLTLETVTNILKSGGE
ncbi:SIR2 family protein [uncultured Rothia sp.]|uniref:SIR2 family protein n=1 Tax=uncultured Rothia sp. TaxID=316088 RepID=UPI0028D071B0|nr:SIR2 family protein [uncultured Rothia sp.]